VSLGKATITATAANGKKARCTVLVHLPWPASIQLDQTTLSLFMGESSTLTATLSPEGSDPTVTWSSSNEAVATVNENGEVSALLFGQATITVTTHNGLQASCALIVNKKAPTGIQVTPEAYLAVGYSVPLTATVLPYPGALQGVTWSSANPAIVSIDAETGVATGVALGSAEITVAAVDDPSITTTCTVIVSPMNELTLTGYTGNNVLITHTDGSTESLPVENEQALFIASQKTIKSITPEGGSAILIGRKADGNISLKLNGTAIAFRDAVDGAIPIGSYAEFLYIKTNATTLAGNYTLEADLDFMNNPSWGGGDATKFTGVFDGANHAISNLVINGTGNTHGLFGYLSGAAVVKNLGIASGSISTTGVIVGGFAGKMEGTAAIIGCYNKASVSSTGGNMNQVGGIVGWSIAGTDCKIIACYNTGRIQGASYVGGIVGYATGVLNVTACYNTGNVTGTGTVSLVAGIVPDVSTNNFITACYNTGTIACGAGSADEGAPIGANNNNKRVACYALTNTNNANVMQFSGTAWPATSAHAQWGVGDGSGDGKYWKDLGSWNSGSPVYPKLFFEQ
jgi:uncharacterized protein YjdB